jgi:hypothetical protein
MKLKASAAAAVTRRPPTNWFSGTLFALLIIILTLDAADAQRSAEELNPAEEWVVAQVSAGKIADLTEKFPDEEKEKRKLSAEFLENLLIGTLPGVKPRRNRVLIRCAIIDEAIDLDGLPIQYQVMLDHCQFNSSVTFTRAGLASSVSFDGSTFEKEATFNSMKVGGSAFFHDTIFKGPASFVSIDIANNFEANGARFLNKEEGADFSGMKVGNYALFRNVVFGGPVSFIWANIGTTFEAQEAQFRNKKKIARFNGMKVGGYALFKDAVFKGSVNLDYTDFGLLDLSSPFWPKRAAQFHMHGMSYKSIRAVREDEPKSHKALLKLAHHSAYSADVYGNLEDFFLRRGYRDDADRAFIAGKRRERKETLHGLGYLGSYLLDWLVGYGRRPWQAGIPCAVLVALGCVFFSPRKMELQKSEDVPKGYSGKKKEPQKSEHAPRGYSRFWYSLGLFLPFVDLQTVKMWKPKDDQTFLRNYMRLHILLGWILIPLVLAALTGLIK